MFFENTLLASAVRIERDLPTNLNDEDLHDFIGHDVYQTCDSVLRHFPWAQVSSASLIYKNLVVDSESLFSRRHHKYYQTRHLAKKLLLANKVTLDSTKNYLLATDQESGGHFHWLTEVLPRLWQIREQAHQFVLLLPDIPYIRSIGIESIGMLGFDFKDIVWMRDDQFFKVPNLFHISKVAQSGKMHDGMMKELRQDFTSGTLNASRKIYISRADATRRKVLNDEDLTEMLMGHGFEVFTGDRISLKQQIELFSECGIIIGIHGAGLSNCLFMPPGTVVELKKKEPTYAYWHLAGSLGHKYYYYNGIPDSDRSLIGTGCNLTIAVRDFEKNILGLLEKVEV